MSTFPPEIQRELWCATFGTSGEEYSWWHEVTFLEGDWDEPGVVRLGIEDPDQPRNTIKKIVTYDDVEAAALKAMSTSVDACTGLGISISADMDWDACVSDCVLQIAVLGEVVYG